MIPDPFRRDERASRHVSTGNTDAPPIPEEPAAAGACPHCGQVPAGPSHPPAVLAYAGRSTRGRFRWVWCHFFRNGLVLAGVGSVTGCLADFPHQGSWIVSAIVCFATAMGFHLWHAAVCDAEPPT